MPALNYTAALRDAIAKMRAHSTDTKIGLVRRWNERDDFIWTIYSEFLDQVDDLNIAPGDRATIDRKDGTIHPNGSETFAPPRAPVHQIGCHAEEIMIANWPYYEGKARAADAGRTTTPIVPPTKVDLILSKSPCTGPGGSQALVVGNAPTYGTGCARKLSQFCVARAFADAGTEWRIYYCNLPPEKIRESRFSQLAAQHPDLDPEEFVEQPPEGMKRKDWQREANTVAQKLKQIKAPESLVYGQGSPKGHSPVGDLVRLALSGIGLLNGTRNVTCEPLSGA